MLALLSAHWPNFWDVLVKLMLGVTVQLMIACTERQNPSPFTGSVPSLHYVMGVY